VCDVTRYHVDCIAMYCLVLCCAMLCVAVLFLLFGIALRCVVPKYSLKVDSFSHNAHIHTHTHTPSFTYTRTQHQFMDVSEDELRKEAKDVSLPRIQGMESPSTLQIPLVMPPPYTHSSVTFTPHTVPYRSPAAGRADLDPGDGPP
jgi:hypothetical protein